MKRIWTWIFYGIGALAIAYLALYAYAVFTGRGIELENPIHIFRRPDAPDYSRRSPVPDAVRHVTLLRGAGLHRGTRRGLTTPPLQNADSHPTLPA
jgi:hypothetical protein